jgi:hypothetical protein
MACLSASMTMASVFITAIVLEVNGSGASNNYSTPGAIDSTASIHGSNNVAPRLSPQKVLNTQVRL